MSEQAQEETKWRLGELARVRAHHGHASAVRLRRQQENGARPTRNRTISTFVTVQSQEIHRHALALTIWFQRKDKFFFCGDHCVSRRERSLICLVSGL